ncbi:hypothetical protein A2130_02530 [Candidatus Woesebacteria bacterium GWC2_33_12]|uniref:Uncharacterized protein n=1 Tax=Candidatus Woesebacteria bacterium GW2011_GWB1_33_22 TaxID=1618566 RepID=A0A0F9ZJ88_9BACT|nr:MAG: hypothetical protein UR29_C0013G0004 [Candidatus Woesebacteria bacterium GW2011_GWC2_33_12]KKP41689.1 MAG: hypothetical protein UR33_C0011G0004 [Candidatus Woesebacteria bacterium GW2011_GWA2_33_20]KKP44174.1 MAG: hypothetical protein UR35_C0011G0060 [Candidatus Woesebacteria bacterium GW2011_GWB1_33_22]KKP45833.1 MAG: hypothetical protein UR37_C0014G0060 [Microgenomates group bacterium GW2011_GWC1_33_28]KKP50255.1 MAG: hypothetical protein UR41_C0010G0059 [Candidatus Woesebacteria bact
MALPKQIIDPRFERLPLFKLIIVTIVTNIVVILLGILSKIILPPQIPIFFGLPQTEEQLAPALFITIPPIISLIFVLINSIMAINLESSYVKKSLAFASLAVTLLSTIAVFKIIFLVGSI